MFDCEERGDILGTKVVRITTTSKAWNKLLKTGLWDKVVEVLADESEGGENELSK